MNTARLLLLSLSASVGALAAPPEVTFDAAAAIVTVPAGHGVAWVRAGKSSVASGLSADADGDGMVRIDSDGPLNSTWVIADLETGEWTTTRHSAESSLARVGLEKRSIQVDPDGAYSQLFVREHFGDGGGAIWIRPGVGVWAPPGTAIDGACMVARVAPFLLLDVSLMIPLGSSGPTPDGFARGDVLLVVEEGFSQTGVVDARLDDPPSAGFLSFPHMLYGRYPEGRETSVDIVRILGTAGTITATCKIPEHSPHTTPGVDFVPMAPQLLTFAPGETVKRCTFTLLDDGVYSEFTRALTMRLTGVTGAQNTQPLIYTVLIDDDDPPPVLSFDDLPASVPEGDASWTLNVPWSITSNFRGEIPVTFVSWPTYTTHVLSAEERHHTSAITVAADDVPSPPRTIRVELRPDFSSPIQPVIRTITVVDDDTPPAPVVSLSAAPTPLLEGNSGTTPAVVHVQLAAPLAVPVTLGIASANGTASAEDYVPISTSVTFQPGDTAEDISLFIVGDTLDEEDETILVHATFEGKIVASLTLTIVDDDLTPYASIADTTVAEKTGSSATAVFRVSVSPAPPAPASVRYATENSTAGPQDFAATAGILSFASGQTEAQVFVEVFGDAITEDDERFSVRLSNPTGMSILDAVGWATIHDDDAPVSKPVLSIDDIEVTESNSTVEATFVLRLSKAPGESVQVSYATAGRLREIRVGLRAALRRHHVRAGRDGEDPRHPDHRRSSSRGDGDVHRLVVERRRRGDLRLECGLYNHRRRSTQAAEHAPLKPHPPVPLVHDGGSLAGNDSAIAWSIRSSSSIGDPGSTSGSILPPRSFSQSFCGGSIGPVLVPFRNCQQARGDIALRDPDHRPLHDELASSQRYRRPVEEREPSLRDERSIDVPHHRRERRRRRLARVHHGEELAGDRRMFREPELALVPPGGDRNLLGVHTLHRTLLVRAGERRPRIVGGERGRVRPVAALHDPLQRLGVDSPCDVIHERDRLRLRVEEPPGVVLAGASCPVARDDDRVRVRLVLGLGRGPNGHDRGADLRPGGVLRLLRRFA